AVQTTVLSLTALRRLRFPLNGASSSVPAVDEAARTTLAALGLYAAALGRVHGADLRSRCQLRALTPIEWELLDAPARPPERFDLPPDVARSLFEAALSDARAAGLPWRGEEVVLRPSPALLALVRRSQELAAAAPADAAEA